VPDAEPSNIFGTYAFCCSGVPKWRMTEDDVGRALGQRRVHVERRARAAHHLLDHHRERERPGLAAVLGLDRERAPAGLEQRLPRLLEAGRDADLAVVEPAALGVAGTVERAEHLLHPAVGLLEDRRDLVLAPVAVRRLAEDVVEPELLEQEERQVAEVGFVEILSGHRGTSE
jgi:hypothetical protein